MWQFWIIASGIFFVAEIFTAGFLVFWLGVAALIAMISSFITSNIIIQTAIFVIFSVILLFATRPFVNKFVNTKTIPTNAFSIIGKTALVVQEINPIKETGQIKINGEDSKLFTHFKFLGGIYYAIFINITCYNISYSIHVNKNC